MGHYRPLARLESFRAYCKKQNINLLKDDLNFINRMLLEIDSDDFKAILMRYIEKWLSCMGDSDKNAHSVNLARKTANLWLLEYTEDVKMNKRAKSAQRFNNFRNNNSGHSKAY